MRTEVPILQTMIESLRTRRGINPLPGIGLENTVRREVTEISTEWDRWNWTFRPLNKRSITRSVKIRVELKEPYSIGESPVISGATRPATKLGVPNGGDWP